MEPNAGPKPPLTQAQTEARSRLVGKVLDLAPKVPGMLDRMAKTGDPKALMLAGMLRQIFGAYSGRMHELAARAEHWDPRDLAREAAPHLRALLAEVEELCR